MPPIMGTAMRSMTSEPVPWAPEDLKQVGHDGDDGQNFRPRPLDGAFHDRGGKIIAGESATLGDCQLALHPVRPTITVAR